MIEYDIANGGIVHIEFNTDEIDEASAFLRATFSWEFEEYEDMGVPRVARPEPAERRLHGPDGGPVQPADGGLLHRCR